MSIKMKKKKKRQNKNIHKAVNSIGLLKLNIRTRSAPSSREINCYSAYNARFAPDRNLNHACFRYYPVELLNANYNFKLSTMYIRRFRYFRYETICTFWGTCKYKIALFAVDVRCCQHGHWIVIINVPGKFRKSCRK